MRRTKRRRPEDIRRSKPLLGFGWPGVALTLIALALLWVLYRGYDLAYYVIDAFGRVFGPKGVDWYMYRFHVEQWFILDHPAFGPVALTYTLLALQIHPRRVGWWRVLLVVAWALVAPTWIFLLSRRLDLWHNWGASVRPFDFVKPLVVSTFLIGVGTSCVLSIATRSWRVGLATLAAAVIGAAAWWEWLTPAQIRQAFFAGHACMAGPLLVWAIRARLRPEPPEYACGSCGYDLIGLAPSSPCPECGAAPGPAVTAEPAQ